MKTHWNERLRRDRERWGHGKRRSDQVLRAQRAGWSRVTGRSGPRLPAGCVVSFLSRHLLGDVGYDSWLSGVEAQTRWVAPKLATIETKE